MSATVEELFEELRPDAAAAAIALRTEGPARVAVACGSALLADVLRNLLRNAIKYLGSSSRREVTVRVKTDGPWAHIEVVDSGPGLPLELQDRVFEPWFRSPGETPGGGLGLGLATVKRIVEAHGGRVGVRSTPGTGSVFWFELARVPDGALQGRAEA